MKVSCVNVRCKGFVEMLCSVPHSCSSSCLIESDSGVCAKVGMLGVACKHMF